jgi:hypothetical protein
MKIKHNLHKVSKNIYALEIENDFDRAMSFLRVSEFYESKKYKGKHIDIWEFIREYSNGGDFKYATDWEAFNLPIKVAKECIGEVEIIKNTPYDIFMWEILWELPSTGYLIGIKSLEGSAFLHEICHALYYTNEEYKQKADEITNQIDNVVYKKLQDSLLSLGYHKSVTNDEIQAYFTTEKLPIISDFMNKSDSTKLHKEYKNKLGSYLKQITKTVL